MAGPLRKKTGVIFTRDVKIRRRDGVDLRANVFRHAEDLAAVTTCQPRPVWQASFEANHI